MLSFNNIRHMYDGQVLIDNFSLTLNQDQVITIIGPSGCGKSILLKLVTGQVPLQSGTIEQNQTQIGYQSQKDLLLPWFSVYDNITLPLTISKTTVDQDYLHELITIFDLQDCLHLYPHQISGGMKSRANLLQTILRSDNLLLLDEPFTGLDMITKYRLITWLNQTIRTLKKSVLYITHDIDEAITISDQIIVVTKNPMTINKVFEKKQFDKQQILQYLL